MTARGLAFLRKCLISFAVILFLAPIFSPWGVTPAHAQPLSEPSVTPFQPNVPWGGRTVAVDVSPANTAVAIAASESGGLFETADSGVTWVHIDSLPPFRMTDVKFAPSNAQVIIASTLVDLHSTNQGGIWLSGDGGVTWQKPATSNPPSDTCPSASTYGISFAPDTSYVYVGTDCGVAVSPDLGQHWNHYSLSPTWSVVASKGRTVDTCSQDGHHRSTTSGTSFGPAFLIGLDGYASGCWGLAAHSIAASPLESGVLFAATGPTKMFESDDGGGIWFNLNPPFNLGSRAPWVATHLSSDGVSGHIDLYFGSGLNTYRQTCTNTGGQGQFLRCSLLTSAWSQVRIDHPDQNGMAFSTSGNCGEFIVSDGGVHRTSDCGATWTVTGGGSAGYDALQVYDLTGEVLPDQTDLYFGTQDNGGWAGISTSSSVFSINSKGQIFGDLWVIQVQHDGTSDRGDNVTGTFGFPPAVNFHTSPLDWQTCGSPCVNGRWINPPGGTPGSASSSPYLVAPGSFIQWSNISVGGPFHLYFTNSPGYFIDTGCGAPPACPIVSPGAWVDEGVTEQAPYGQPFVAVAPSGIITVYQPIVLLSTSPPIIGLDKITGVGSSSVTKVPADGGILGSGSLSSIGAYCDGMGTFLCPVALGVDPHNPEHLIAADAGTNQMKVSLDGGLSWTPDPVLTSLVTGYGGFEFGLPSIPGVGVEQEAHVISINGNTILVGTESEGIIASLDGGQTWAPLFQSDQVTAITSFFFDERLQDILVSSYGRGIWQVHFTPGPTQLSINLTGFAPHFFPTLYWGDNVTLSGTLLGWSGLPVAYAMITFSGTGVCDLVLFTGVCYWPSVVTTDQNGRFEAQGPSPSFVGHGFTVQAHFAGDPLNLPSDSNIVAYNTIAHPTTMTLGPASASVKIGTGITLTANVEDSIILTSLPFSFPVGTVSWRDGGASGSFSDNGACTLKVTRSFGQIPLLDSCSIVYTPPVSTSPVTITATFPGNSLYLGTVASMTLSVLQRTSTTIVACSPGIVQVNAPSTCTATVTDNDVGTPLTPTRTFSFGTSSSGTFTPLASCALNPSSGSVVNCSVTYTPSPGSEGTHTINGTYLGDVAHARSGGSFALTVVQRSTSTVVTCVGNPVFLNGKVTCTATVTDASPGTSITPTGTATFASTGTGIFSAPSCPLKAGSCSVTYNATSVNIHTISAAYSGDTDHLAGSPGSFALSVIYNFSEIQLPPPRHVDGTYHLGKALQVTFQLTDANGNFVSTATAMIWVDKICPGQPDMLCPGQSPGNANSGNLFNYDFTNKQYVYILSTSSTLVYGTVGPHTIIVTLDDGTTHSTTIILSSP